MILNYFINILQVEQVL